MGSVGLRPRRCDWLMLMTRRSALARRLWQEVSDATVLHASMAKAFSPPNIYDRYRTFVSGTTLFLSNPDLRIRVARESTRSASCSTRGTSVCGSPLRGF